ncbi:protein of unknown function [Azospirillum baldaniorum]|uniref:Uncharacterized protein n=1 Tax=Azospirillum baldaniorum TaxID=1064539 RepID=A0A9P1NKQ0_9PROT|nr:protein of unknown function [Azospirillum baldaniorum]
MTRLSVQGFIGALSAPEPVFHRV